MNANRPSANQVVHQIGLVIFAITICLTTLFVFPIIGYASLAFYGLPAAVFLLLGYVIGINIFSTNPKMGIAFAVGFMPPVAFFLLILLPGAPISIIISLLPVTCLWSFHHVSLVRKVDEH